MAKAETPLTLTLFGGFLAQLAGHAVSLPTRKSQGLLSYLALHPGQVYLRDKLVSLFWGDVGREQARHSLSQTLFTLRKALPPGAAPVLVVDGERISLDRAAVDVDVVTFEDLLAEGTPTALARAAALYRGELLEGFALEEETFEEWLRAERLRLSELAVGALTRLADHQVDAGASEIAIQTASRLLEFDPLREETHRTLMRLYSRQGRVGAALRQYQSCVGVLRRELGTEPEPATQALYRQILPLREQPFPPSSASPPTRPWGPHPAPADRPLLVGRAAQLLQLREAFHEASAGRGRAICILGEAGVGKTRLVEELTTEASDHQDFVLTARAWEFERDLTFGPWVEVLRAGLGHSPQESVRELEPVWQNELARLLPELGHASPRPAGDPLRLFEAVGRCLARLTAHRPLLLVLEDLHWADEPSLRLFIFLARRIATLPVLMIATAREEELGDVPVLAGFFQTLEPGPVQVMALPPLTEGDTLALAHQVVRPGAPLAVVAWRDSEVWRLSQGNPFVVVETLRALEASDVPAAGAPVTLEVFRTGGVELRLHLPSRVREVILARFARLGTVSRDLASLAAVVGRECDFALLEGAAGLDAGATAAGVEELVRERWLQSAGMRFEFTHDRVREVVYDRLLPPERARLHRLIASTIERLHGDDLGSHHVALAAHFRVGEVWDKAAEHLAWAGLQAGARSANREAAGFFEHALETLQRLPGGRRPRHLVIDLHIALEHSLLLTGALGLAHDNLHVAETTAVELGDRRRLGWVANYLSEYFRTIGDQTRAIEYCERALAAGDDMGDRTLQAEARLRLGQACHARGDYERGAELLSDNTAALGEPVSDGNDRSFLGALTGQRARAGLLTVLSRTWLVWCLAELGEFSEGIAHAEEGVRLAEDASGEDPFRAMLAHLALGRVWLRKGEGLRALPALERCRELERVGNFKVWSPSVTSTLGYALVSCGRLEEAIGLLRESIDQASSMNTLFGHSLRLAYLGEALLLSGHADEAVGHAVQALEVATACRERGHEAYARRLLAEATAARESADIDAAVTAYQAAIELVDELRMRPLLAQCHEGLGRLYQRSARHREADEHLTAAADLCHDMGMRLGALPINGMKALQGHRPLGS